MAAWTTRKASTTTNEAGFFTRDDDKQRKIRAPKGYLPVVLVRDDDGDDEGGAGTTETRVLVRVSDLKEPCMAALLEAAEEQFGYEQPPSRSPVMRSVLIMWLAWHASPKYSFCY